MVDNVTLNAGSGGVDLATDDDGTAHHQYVKVEWGADNTQTPVASGASALPIQDGGNAITVDGTVAATQSGAWNVTNVSGTVSLPTGAATSANQTTIVGHVDGIEALLTTIDADTSSMNTDLGTLAGAVAGTEMQVDVVAALPAGTNAIGKLAANTGVDIGDVDVTSIAAGSNLVGDVGLSGARTSGGTTLYKNIDVDESEDQVKGTAGQVYWIHAMNLSAAVKYLKIYNATAATVVVGTTVPDLTFPLATQGDTNGAGFVLSIPNGIAFSTAITIAATTGVADADSGAPGANEVIVNLGYA
jgi:hypothetical protein